MTTVDGNVTLQAETGNITILDSTTTVDIDGGNNGTITLQADTNEANIQIGTGAKVQTLLSFTTVTKPVTKGIVITADNIEIQGTISAANSIVTLQPKRNSSDIAIDLGSTVETTTDTLELFDAEIDKITANILRIGSNSSSDGTGSKAITFTAAISVNPANVTNTILLSDKGITQNASASFSGTNLLLDVDEAAVMTESNNDVTTLAAVITDSGAALSFTDKATLLIGTVAGVKGLTTNNADITLVASTGNLTVTDNSVTNDINAGTGSVVMTASDNETTVQIEADADVKATGGVTITADKMILSGTITATGAIVTLKPEVVKDVDTVDLGSTTDVAANSLELSDAELDNITATTIRVGSTTSGAITVSADLSPAASTNLSLLPDANVSQQTGDTITVTGLRIDVDTSVVLNEANNVTTLAVNIADSSQTFSFTDSNALTVGTVDGTVGVTTSGGTITISTTTGTFTVTNNIAAGAAAVNLTAGADDQLFDNNAAITGNAATVTAADMALEGGTVNVGSGIVTLIPDSTDVDAIDLGNGTEDSADTLELSDTELDTITALTLRIGATNTGAITVSSAMNPANITNLSLLSDFDLSQSAIVTVSGLRIDVDGPVTMTQANVVTTLAANVSTSGQGFTFNDSNDIVVGTVDGTVGVTTNGGTLTVTTANGNLTVTNNVAAGAATVILTAGGTDKLIDNNAAVTGNAANLAADDMALEGGTVNVGSGIVTLAYKTAGIAIDLGDITDSTAATLELSDSELDKITALTLRIGGTNAGAITVTTALTPANITNLSLLSTAGVTQGTGDTITVSGLRIDVDDAVTLTEANDVTTLSAVLSTSGQAFSFTDANTL
ncbi:MAG: hypothetical protein JKY23_02750, partial [Nitrospinaceae bacterium]|nr:hypothetical protein [Nitrospinaceae bacterium]